MITKGERQIAQLVAEGRTDKEIAQAINVSWHAARQRLRTLSEKIGASNRVQVAVWYVRECEVRS